MDVVNAVKLLKEHTCFRRGMSTHTVLTTANQLKQSLAEKAPGKRTGRDQDVTDNRVSSYLFRGIRTQSSFQKRSFLSSFRRSTSARRWSPPISSKLKQEGAQLSPPPLPPAAVLTNFVIPLLFCGATTGPLLDGIHSRVQLQIYDVLPLTIGPLTTAGTVPILLSAFYAVIGSAHVALDHVLRDDEATSKVLQKVDGGYVALTYGVLAALLQLSASLYDNGLPFPQISLILGVASIINWKLLDGTRQGLGLAILCAVAAPVWELLLMSWWGVWHYPRGDVLGFPSWVPWCYFFYTPAVGNLARWTWAKAQASQNIIASK